MDIDHLSDKIQFDIDDSSKKPKAKRSRKSVFSIEPNTNSCSSTLSTLNENTNKNPYFKTNSSEDESNPTFINSHSFASSQSKEISNGKKTARNIRERKSMGCREFCCLGCLSTNNKKIDDENEAKKPKNNKPNELANKSFHDTVIQKRKSISSSSASTITDVNSRNRFKYNVNINNNKANNVEKMNNKIAIVNSAKISVNKDYNVNESKKRRFRKNVEDGFVSSTSADDDDPKDIDYIVEKIYRTRKQKQKLNSNNIFSDVDLIENNNNHLLAQSQHKIKSTNFQANYNPCKTQQKNSASVSKRNTNDETSTNSAMNSDFYLNRSNSINSSINSTIENTINNNLNDIVIGANAASGNGTAETYLIDRYNYAVRHIKQGLSVEEACNKYRISKGALLKCLSGGTAPRGKKTRLTESEENEIVDWLINYKYLKYNDAIHLVFEKVVTIFKEAQRPNPFNNGRPSMDWWYDFLSRHPQIIASKPDWLMRGKVNDQYIKDVQSGQLKCTKFRRALLSAIQYIQTLNDPESTNSLNISSVPSNSLKPSSNKLTRSSRPNQNNNQMYIADTKVHNRNFFKTEPDANDYDQRDQTSNHQKRHVDLNNNLLGDNKENTNEEEDEFYKEFLNATLNVDDNQLSELIDPNDIAEDQYEYDLIIPHQSNDDFHLNVSLSSSNSMNDSKNSFYQNHQTLNKQQNYLLVPDDDDENDDDNNSNNINNSIVNYDDDDAYMGETIDPATFLS